MSGAVPIRGFERTPNVALRGQDQSIGGHGRPGDIPAQALKLAPLVVLGGDPCMWGEPGGLGQVAVIVILLPGWNGLQRERLAPDLGPTAMRSPAHSSQGTDTSGRKFISMRFMPWPSQAGQRPSEVLKEKRRAL